MEAKAHHREAANSIEADSGGGRKCHWGRTGVKTHAQAFKRTSACIAIEGSVGHQGLEEASLEADMDHGREPFLLCMPDEILQDIADRLPTQLDTQMSDIQNASVSAKWALSLA